MATPSRQQVWRLARVAAGYCSQCGRRELYTARECLDCVLRRRERARARKRCGNWYETGRGRPPVEVQRARAKATDGEA